MVPKKTVNLFWTIENFSSKMGETCLLSDRFPFNDPAAPGSSNFWQIALQPVTGKSKAAWVNLGLETDYPRKMSVRFTIWVVDVNGAESVKIYSRTKKAHVFPAAPSSWTVSHSFPGKMLTDAPLDDGSVTLKVQIQFRPRVASADGPTLAAGFGSYVQEGFLSRYMALYNSGNGSDVALLANDGLKFDVHRLILSTHSPVFAAMFNHQSKRSTGSYNLDVDGETLDTILKFVYSCYTDQIKPSAEKVLVAADKYGLRDLKHLCEDQLLLGLTKGTAAHLVVLGDQSNSAKLTRAAFQFIKENMMGFLDAGGVEEVAAYDAALLSKVLRHQVGSKKRKR